MVDNKVEKESHRAWGVDMKKAVSDAKPELADAKSALHRPESTASLDSSAMHTTTDDCDGVRGELATPSAKLQFRKRGACSYS